MPLSITPARPEPIGLALVLSFAAACASTRPDPDRRLQMDPVVVRAQPDSTVGLDSYDASTLFELGSEAFRAEKWARSLEVFDKLVEEFPEAEEVPTAHFNAGLAAEKLERYEAAAAHFALILEKYRDSSVFHDAHFNLARAYAKLKAWKKVSETFWAARQLPELSAMDEIEARVGTGVGLFMDGDPFTAEREFRQAIGFFEDHPQKEYLPARYFIAQSRFYLGEILAREFESIELTAPTLDGEEKDWVQAMSEELEKKCDLLLRAQANFIRTIREGHQGWATAAGFRIGSLYERLFDEMVAVPVPPDLEEGAAELYREELRAKVSVLVRKAIRVYEANREMAERVGEANEWVEKTSAALERMKELYLSTAS